MNTKEYALSLIRSDPEIAPALFRSFFKTNDRETMFGVLAFALDQPWKESFVHSEEFRNVLLGGIDNDDTELFRALPPSDEDIASVLSAQRRTVSTNLLSAKCGGMNLLSFAILEGHNAIARLIVEKYPETISARVPYKKHTMSPINWCIEKGADADTIGFIMSLGYSPPEKINREILDPVHQLWDKHGKETDTKTRQRLSAIAETLFAGGETPERQTSISVFGITNAPLIQHMFCKAERNEDNFEMDLINLSIRKFPGIHPRYNRETRLSQNDMDAIAFFEARCLEGRHQSDKETANRAGI